MQLTSSNETATAPTTPPPKPAHTATTPQTTPNSPPNVRNTVMHKSPRQTHVQTYQQSIATANETNSITPDDNVLTTANETVAENLSTKYSD